MKRLIASLALLCSIAPAHPAQASWGNQVWRTKECRFQYLDGKRNWSSREIRQTIRCGARRYGVSLDTALMVAERESHTTQFATNPSSGACGTYQHLPRYWAGRFNAWVHANPWMAPAGPSCYNARSNVLVSLWMAKAGWGPWAL